MRIAIDVRALASQLTGGGYYTYHLLGALSLLDRENEYLLCAHRPPAHLPPGARQRFRVGGGNYPSGLLWQQVALGRLLVREKADVFHSPLFTLPPRLRCPAIVTVFDLTAIMFPHWHRLKVRYSQKGFLRRSLRDARKVIAISRATRDDILKYFPSAEGKVVVIPLAAPQDFRPREEDSFLVEKLRKGLGKEHGFLLYLGTLEPRKNLPFLLRSYRRLRERMKGETPRLVLAGAPGWKYQAIHREIGLLGLSESVTLTGYVKRRDLPCLYQAARLFLFPSLYEGFGLPPLEAMACGTPVIVSSRSSLPEVVGEAGILADPEDEEAWGKVMEQVLTDKDLARRMKADGLRQAAEFSWERVARETLSLYREVAG